MKKSSNKTKSTNLVGKLLSVFFFLFPRGEILLVFIFFVIHAIAKGSFRDKISASNLELNSTLLQLKAEASNKIFFEK